MKRQLVTMLIVGTLLSACDDGKSNPSTPTAPSLQTTAFRGTVVAAAATDTVRLTEGATCTFNIEYTWSGLGGGQNDQAVILLFGVSGGNSFFAGGDTKNAVSGQGGSFSTSLTVTGHSSSAAYNATGELLNSHSGNVVHNSRSVSANTITETCT